MRFSLFFLAALLAPTATASEPFTIDEYEFTWKVASSGEATLSISKTEETTRIVLREDYDAIYISPDDAVAIGVALADTNKYFAKMKGANDQNEEVAAGGYDVSFSQSKEHGFWIHIRKREQFSISSLTIGRSQAAAFAPWLQKRQSWQHTLTA